MEKFVPREPKRAAHVAVSLGVEEVGKVVEPLEDLAPPFSACSAVGTSCRNVRSAITVTAPTTFSIASA